MKKDSKTKLLEAALKEFAKNGFYGATTRDIAKRAGLNISAIMYYFGGKKGIYTAVLESIVVEVNALFSDLSAQYNGNKVNEKEAKILLKDIISRFLSVLTDDNISKDMKKIFFAEYFQPSDDFSILYEGLILPFHKKFAHLLMIASQGKIKKQDSLLYAFPVFAQLFVFSSRKNAICQFMGWETFGEKEKTRLLKTLSNQIEGLIA